MKTTKIYLVVCLTFLLTQFNAFAQYNGGNSNGSATNQLSVTSCSIPSHFYAYFGGVNDGSSVGDLSTTTCGTAAFQFAYMGGAADGAATEEFSATACGVPPSFFAYMGGNNDGAGVETFEQSVCGFPAQFYAYFGGNGDGYSMGITAPICPTQPPIASFTASATEICVGQSVTFTDTSTNIPSAWTWTFTGGTPNSSIVQNPVITYNSPGSYAVTLVSANYNGTDTETLTSYITVYATPTVTSTTPANRCGSGTLTLAASASAGMLSWFANPTGGTALGTGTSFVTPSIAVTTPFYVETVNGVCTSARTLVNATINTIPTIISTTPNSRCGTGSVVLDATTSVGGGIPIWYASPSGGTALATTNSFTTPSIAVTTTYYVEASNGTCTSTSRTPVIATVNALPTVLTTTPASRCDAGTVTIGATASSGTLNWFAVLSGGTAIGTGTSFTTPSISITTTYYVEATIGSCTSARTAVIATVNSTPSITSTTPNSRCDSGAVLLGATASTGVLNWYNVSTGGSILGSGTSFTTQSIATTTTYYVEAVNGSCTSIRTAVIATVNTTPTITSTSPNSRCGAGTVVLSATSSAGNTIWYSVPTGGTALATTNSFTTPSISTTTTFYVEASTGSCISSPRTAVIATVNAAPTVLTTTPASRCNAGTVTLGATASSGTLSWYANPTGGSAIGTGTSFITPSISATTTYYVETVNGICSSSRTAVIATVNTSPIIVNTTPNSRCGSGIVTLGATSSVGTPVWYANASGGTALATTNSFTTPSIAITTNYYVEAVNGTCISTPRIAVIATVNAIPVVLTTTPGSRCDTGTVTLGATASAGVLNWYNVPTGGSILGTGTSFTTPSIAATTTYYVEANDGTCSSVRTAVVATASVTPTITSTAPNSRCDAGTVTLSATASSGGTVWYANATGGTPLATTNSFTTPSISTTTTYYVEAVNGSCISPRVPVVATVNTSPSIITTTPASACTPGCATLAATASSGTIQWFTVASGGTVYFTGANLTICNLPSTSTYYVQTTNGTCTSNRVPVVYTVTGAIPSILSTTGGNRCGPGTVVLNATADSGTLNWYTASTGGTLLGTGNSFTTPSISTTTIYYVEASNGTCSSNRLAVTASILSTSPPIATANQTFCAGEVVGSIVVIPSGTSIIWYTSASGGTVVLNGTALVSGTTYYASQTNNGCESTVRTPVTMTLGTCLGNEEFVANVIKLYPNPAIDFVTISSTETITKIEVVNMLGQIIFSDSINETETSVDMARYAAGTYIIRVLANEKMQTFKVIKK